MKEAALLLSCDLKSENSQVSLRVAELLTKSTFVRMDNNPDGEAAHVLKELQINAGGLGSVRPCRTRKKHER